ncbi:MAG: hypothetical protein R3F49_20510 [Planctomycetota bacterium]
MDVRRGDWVARWTRGAAVLGLLGPGMLVSGGCKSSEAASHNLDVLMSSEERLRYVGDLRSAIEQLVRGFVDPSMLEEGSWLGGSDDTAIPDPTDAVVENLLALSHSTDGPDRWREAEQVRQLARYASVCPAGLGRERALLELAPHGLRLGIDQPLKAGKVANAEELRVRLEALVDGAKQMLALGNKADATATADFEAACRVLAEAEVDIAGGRRVLRAVSPFLRLSGLPDAAERALVDLSEALQKRLVTEALARGLHDEAPYVRAAALRANAAVFGDPFLIEAALSLGVEPLQARLPDGLGEAYTAFGVPSEDVDIPDARVEVCRLLVERGLPKVAAASDGAGLTLRFGLYYALTQVATSYNLFHPMARSHAMLALDAVSGARLGSLREEVWDAWWREVGPGLDAQAREQRKLDAAGRSGTDARAGVTGQEGASRP